jgi:hypothetical protein
MKVENVLNLDKSRFEAGFKLKPGLFTRRWRQIGENLFYSGIAQGSWFRQFTHDVRLTSLQNQLVATPG